MKVYIGKPRSWIGPYQIASALTFWVKKVPDELGLMREPDWVHDKLGAFLAHGWHYNRPEGNNMFKDERPKSWLYKALEKLHAWRTRNGHEFMYIKIDDYDVWSLEHTLAPIILPALKKLKEHKHGSGIVDLDDVPERLRYTTHENYDDQKCLDGYHEDSDRIECDVHTRYDWVLDEMIWAFEQLQPGVDWEAQFQSGESDWYSEPCAWDENGKPTMYEMKSGPNDTFTVDYDARNAYNDRIQNGLRLFGKYFQTLWT